MDLSDEEIAGKMRRWLLGKPSLKAFVEDFRLLFQATELSFLNFYLVTSPQRSPRYGKIAPNVRYWTYVFYIARHDPNCVYFTFTDSPLGIYRKRKIRGDLYEGNPQNLFLGPPGGSWALPIEPHDEEALYYPLDWEKDLLGTVPLYLERYQDLYKV